MSTHTRIGRLLLTSLLTACQFRQLLTNGSPDNCYKDHYPVVKLMMPAVGATWLLSWLDPDDADLGYGLCDTGICPPRLHHVALSDILSLNEALGFAIERDTAFQPQHPLSVYARAAQKTGRFTDNAASLAAVAHRQLPLSRTPKPTAGLQ